MIPEGLGSEINGGGALTGRAPNSRMSRTELLLDVRSIWLVRGDLAPQLDVGVDIRRDVSIAKAAATQAYFRGLRRAADAHGEDVEDVMRNSIAKDLGL